MFGHGKPPEYRLALNHHGRCLFVPRLPPQRQVICVARPHRPLAPAQQTACPILPGASPSSVLIIGGSPQPGVGQTSVGQMGLERTGTIGLGKNPPRALGP